MNKLKNENPLIIAQGGVLDGQRWLIKDSLLVGRDDECDIIIQNQKVSRRHARFTLTEEGVLFEDLKSKNGSYYRGELIDKPIYLKDEDSVQISLVQKLTVIFSDVTLPIQSFEELNKTKEEKEDSVDYISEKQKDEENISLPPMRLDKKSHRVWIGNKEIKPSLSLLQFNLLELLYNNIGEVVSRKDIISVVWGEDKISGVTEQALDALVRRLRERIEECYNGGEYIKTVRGHGLMLNNWKDKETNINDKKP